MRKRDNIGVFTSISQSNLLSRLMSQNYERKNIDSQTIKLFNAFIINLGDAITKSNPSIVTADSLKLAVELIIAFQSNLSQEFSRHTCTLQEIGQFFYNIFGLFDRLFVSWNDLEKLVHSEAINIIWFLLENEVEQVKSTVQQKKVEALSSLLQGSDAKGEILYAENLIKGAFSIFFLDEKCSTHSVSNLFKSFLRSSLNPQFKVLINKYLHQSIISNHVSNFNKAFAIFSHIGANYQERRASMETFVIKVLETVNNSTFIFSINRSFSFSKVFTSQRALEAVIRTIDKLVQKSTSNTNLLSLLEQLSQLSLPIDLECKFQKGQLKPESFVIKVIDWIISKGVKGDDLENGGKPKLQIEQKSQNIMEIVKKLSKRSVDNGDSENEELGSICACMKKIFKKLLANKCFKSKLDKVAIESFPSLKKVKIISQSVSNFILDIIPEIITDIGLNCKDKSPLIYSIILRKAQIESQKLALSKSRFLQQLFNQTYYQMIHPDSLHYHFILCLVFFRYLPDKQASLQIIIDEIQKDLATPGKNKNNRALLINLELLLRIVYPNTGSLPVKIKIKDVIRNCESLASKMQLDQIFVVSSKDLGMIKIENLKVPPAVEGIQTKVNQEFDNYSKDHVTIFYSLVIALNDLFEGTEKEGENMAQLLQEINLTRKICFLSEIYTLLRCFIDKTNEWKEKGTIRNKKNSVFLLLAKISIELKNKSNLQELQDCNTFIDSLQDFLHVINETWTSTHIKTIQHYKSNKSSYKQDKYYDYFNNKNFVRLYSQSAQSPQSTHIILMRISLKILQRFIQSKGSSIKQLNQQMKSYYLTYLYQQSSQELGFTEKHENQLKQYLSIIVMVDNFNQSKDIAKEIGQLSTNFGVFKELVLEKHQTEHIQWIKQKIPFDFIQFTAASIFRMFSLNSPSNTLIFHFILQIIEQDEKDSCSCFAASIKDRMCYYFSGDIIQTIVKRIENGLELADKARVQFLQDSYQLYQLIQTLIRKIDHQTLIEQIVQIDVYSDNQISAFLLKEIFNIFSVIEQKSSNICEIVFNYIITLTQVFPGQQKLEISNFICNFFDLQSTKPELKTEMLERQPSAVQCNTQANYKCLKCDERRLFCLACSINCHKNHPVCYLNVPLQIKIARCQCKQIPNCCTFSKQPVETRNSLYNKIKSQLPQAISQIGPYQTSISSSGANRQFFEKIRFGRPNIEGMMAGPGQGREGRDRERDRERQRQQLNQLIELDDFDRWDHEFIPKRNYDQGLVKEQFFPRIGRMDRMMDKESIPQHSFRVQMDRSRGQPQPSNYLRQDQRERNPNFKEQCLQPLQPEFIDEQYQKKSPKMEVQQSSLVNESSAILKKYVLLPKFIDLMVSFCSKKSSTDNEKSNSYGWSPNFASPTVHKFMQLSLRLANPGTYHVEIRKENPLNNVSCVLIKKTIAQNNKFFLLASGTDMQVFPKQKVFFAAAEGKPFVFNPIHRHSLSYEIHSIQFSPIDKHSFCASGLHNLGMFTLSTQGGIGRTQNRYNVNNLYINKIKLAKMGIFIGLQKEIRVLNYTCKQILTIKAQESNTLIRQWSIFQKAAGCQVYFVCPNGNIFFTDILPSDEGKKQFISRVSDSRKTKNSTGASVYVKEVPEIGKQLFASFKDGYNILGRLEGDQLENMTDIRLKGIKTDKNIFDNFFIVGHVDMVKIPQTEQLFLICTVKKYFPPQMAFHQGFLTVIYFKKDGTTSIQIINEQSTCEYFQIFNIGPKHFFILSFHTDGSVHLNSPTKIPKNVVEQQSKKSRQNLDVQLSNGASSKDGNFELVRKLIAEQMKLENINLSNITSSYYFRENTDGLKPGIDYTMTKVGEQYELKQVSFSKIITGISFPYFGTATIPTRKIENIMEVGFTNSQALFFYSQGSFKFKFTKSDKESYTRQSINMGNNRMLQKIQRIERINEYSDPQRLLNPNMLSSFLNIKQDSNQDIILIGRSFQTFKIKIPRFDQFFSINEQQSGSIEKTALIIKMFLTKGLQQGHLCDKQSIYNLVASLKKIIPLVDKKLFMLLKDIIVLAMKVVEKQLNTRLNIYTDQNEGLRAATEARLLHFYSLLKMDISDEELNQMLELLLNVVDEDLQLFAFYASKYSGIFLHLHRRLKKTDTQFRAKALVKIYALAYPIHSFCEISNEWMLSTINQIIFSSLSSKVVRQSLYEGLKWSKYLVFDAAIKNLKENQVIVLQKQPQKNMKNDMPDPDRDPIAEIYQMYSRAQIDDQTLLRLIQQATKLQYDKIQQVNHKPQQMNSQMQPQQQNQMPLEEQVFNNNQILLYDLINQCTENFEGNHEVVSSKIITLYVASKVADSVFGKVIEHLFDRILRMVKEIELGFEGQKLHAVLSYSSLFNHVFKMSNVMKNNGFKNYPPYRKIEQQVLKKLELIPLEKVKKIKNPINFLNRIFKGENFNQSISIAYALTNLLIFPCEPSHVLLSLQCYWLLPQSKQSYARKKCESSIRDGVSSGNISKVYQIAKQNPQIWQNSGQYLDFIQGWIQSKKSNWQLALQLLAIYYQT